MGTPLTPDSTLIDSKINAQGQNVWKQDANWLDDTTISEISQAVIWQQTIVAQRVAIVQEEWNEWIVVLPYKPGAEHKELIWK